LGGLLKSMLCAGTFDTSREGEAGVVKSWACRGERIIPFLLTLALVL
jgi:hypothetical protein